MPAPAGFKKYVRSNPRMTSADLAESYQVTRETINNWLRREGIPPRPRVNAVDKSAIRAMLQEGRMEREIMAALKCSRSTVHQFKQEGARG